MTVDVAVIGGGVSGLATAHQLMQRGRNVIVLERQVRVGGNAISERFDGFLMEHGPSSVNAIVPAARELSNALGLDRQCCELGAGVRYRYLTGDGALRRISTHPLGFATANYLSPGARLRVLGEAFATAPASDGEESVADFFTRRFGAEFTERVIDPLVGGLFAGVASELSMAAIFPMLLDMERRYGSMTRGMVSRRLAGGKMPGRRLFSWREGIGTLPLALARTLGDRVRSGTAVRRISRHGDGFKIDVGPAGSVDTRAVVISTQPHVAAELLGPIDTMAAEATADISAPPLAVVFLGYRREQVGHPLDGLGYLSPRGEGRVLTGAQFCSTMFPGRAPEGCVALAGYIGGARALEIARLPAAELVDLAHAEFRGLLGVRGEPIVAKVRQWHRGLPQYTMGHATRIRTVIQGEWRQPGLFVTGNYFTGPSVSACLMQAGETAMRTNAYLSDDTRRKSGTQSNRHAIGD